ncbi:MAG: DUF4956 domain-containing protein [Candidatus Krumholzibacteria bacterium]|nr:DUF4956 domain-containing protein [Candidatus Krumholzibacteria bacterium]
MREVLAKIAQLIQDPGIQIDVTGFIFALVISALVGLLISFLYMAFYENRATGSQIHRSFLLLGPSITALFIAIQFSLPLSLGLLGALSIIRFRTPIKEPEEIGFIMLLIAAAVVCATFQFLLLFVLLALATIVLLTKKFFFRMVGHKRQDGVLLITLDGDQTEETKDKIMKLLDTKLANGKLESVSFTENLTTIHYSFANLKSTSLQGFHTSLKEVAPVQKLNVFYNSQGALF